ncbi:4-alpha-glucanotransferase [bacterium F11]|nr:4-alpha-glucanotransferase [bacterium F11]
MSNHNNKLTLQNRRSGVLAHISSLPGPYGIGDIGPEAYKFVDFLSASGQGWWQMFPLGPEGFGHSPYQTLSVFAGNALFISLEFLEEDGLLTKEDISLDKSFPQNRVDFDRVQEFKDCLFEKAFNRFEQNRISPDYKRFRQFCSKNKRWLDDYAVYRALRRYYNRSPWWEWKPEHRIHHPLIHKKIEAPLGRWIHFHKFLQYEFFKQWNQLKKYSRSKGIGIIGDLPIFVAADSADVWAHQDLFYLKKKGRPSMVAGVPPDYFSKTGQLWGNPLYKWDVHKRKGYRWWIERLRMAFRLFDVVRLDHFIGFHNYWAVPAGEKTAQKGKWKKGPGADFFRKITRVLGQTNFIAEDLGSVTPQIKALREQFHFPGMRVLQFAFGKDPEAHFYLPHNYPKNCVVYTGTHDNDTTMGWFYDQGSSASTRTKEDISMEKDCVLGYLHSNGKEIHWDMIRLAIASPANTAIFPVQDLLGLGTEARMNRPGTTEANWEWRLIPSQLNNHIIEKLLTLTQTYERTNKT